MCYDIREKFVPNRCSILSFSVILSSSTRVIFSLKTTLFDNKCLTTAKNVLVSYKFFSLRFPKNYLLLFRKSVTHKFLCLTEFFFISLGSVFKEKVS